MLLLLIGGGMTLAALWLAVRHPVAPSLVSGAALLTGAWVAARPQTLWFLLPAALPVMSFMPWTGWWLVDESDVLVLSCLGGAFVRWAHDMRQGETPRRLMAHGPVFAIWALLAVSLVVGVWRGLHDAGVDWSALPRWHEAAYAGYDSAWNTWRVGKSLLWALLLATLLAPPGDSDRPVLPRLVARGMLTGLGLVCLMVLWERTVYTGAFNFTQAYRTSAWFWEMHVGGGAIDAYLVMAVPFAVWGMWASSTAPRWIGCNLLMVVAVYAVLTTYSRGVYLAVTLTLLLMGLTAWQLRLPPAAGAIWGRRTLLAVLATLVLESSLVLVGGSFMADRLSRSETDMVNRMDHWRSGVGLLDSPQDWLLGLGLGRFPAHYSTEVPGGQFPGQAIWRGDSTGSGHVLLSGRHDIDQRADLFALTQRIELGEGDTATVRLRASGDSGSRLLVSLCERHLLYNVECRRQWASLNPALGAGDGQVEMHFGKDISGETRGVARWREAVLALSPAQADAPIRIDRVEMFDAAGHQRLLNPDFAAGLQHWLPIAQGRFQPWHLDNLYLDVLIERGWFGLWVFAVWVMWALRHLWRRVRAGDSVAWAYMGALAGILSLGGVISVTEVPRVSLILLILLWSVCAFRGQIEGVSSCNRL
ncbi:hypothetical protein [Hydrogenophaga sp. PBL-H3]|uniref:hypothetical protein n=1 Tax=Hydrogenophaga sp. PBL-H3 TaxID=434010 RepID=UPI001320490B|nr:hypothetical protein [Hydrogenophaga sp. PBL-H3]QHE76688.1 hypothetical protein F9Z45_11780 [Hydrogenophaga sp. PBL-H3]QHE81112.1 hypothetical protein F9Z44_11780 [Hydrogenophaga sp. PBL-H3]